MDELSEEDSAGVAQDHPGRDDIIREVREGDTTTAVVASGHVAIVHAPIIHYAPHLCKHHLIITLGITIVLTICIPKAYRKKTRKSRSPQSRGHPYTSSFLSIGVLIKKYKKILID